jgi:hypothetical protein
VYLAAAWNWKPRALGSRVRPAARPWLHVSAPARRRWTPRHRVTAPAVTERPRRLRLVRLLSGAAGHARRIAGAVKEAGAGRAPRSRLRIDASLATALHFFAIDPVGPLILHSTMAPLIHSTPSNQFPVYRQNTHAFLPRHAKHRPPSALAQESMPWPPRRAMPSSYIRRTCAKLAAACDRACPSAQASKQAS